MEDSSKGFSLFKFSRYFFVLFLLITVLPMLIMLLWSNYDLEQNMSHHQKQFLEMDADRALYFFQQQLASQIDEIGETAKSLDHRNVSLKEYQGIFNVQQAFWLDSEQAHAFFEKHPQTAALLHQSPRQVSGDYVADSKTIQNYFIVPLSGEHRGLLLITTLKPESLVPQGPYQVEIFTGNSLEQSALIYKSDFKEPNGGFLPPFGPKPDGFNHCRGHHLPLGAWQGTGFKQHGNAPPCFGPLSGGNHPHHPLFGDKIAAEKTILLTGLSGAPVATMRLKAFSMPPPPDHPFLRLSQWIGGLILLAGCLSSLMAGSYIRKTFIVPLMRLSFVSAKVQDGDLSIRVDTRDIKHTEVRETLAKFNAMLSGLAEKEQLRNSFVSNLTHDFRTPLIAEQRSLELLRDEFRKLGLADQELLADSILKNNEHLLIMVNHLLEIYQTDAEHLELQQVPSSIPKLIEECFEQLLPMAQERNIAMTMQFPGDFPDISMDEYYLKRVFINLIGNALENIPKDSRIDVIGTTPMPGTVEIRVRDNGPGIPAEEWPLLFERYYAGTGGDTRKLGSGLGLYICKVLITAHHGSIAVESIQEGTKDFVIRLPVGQRKEINERSD
jgi:signal transduction histidine kinase